MKNKIIIGSRGSKLALIYAERAKRELLKKHKIESVEIKRITTTGDTIKDVRLSECGGKGLFCKTIEQELLDRKVDIAVHALKDLNFTIKKGELLTVLGPSGCGKTTNIQQLAARCERTLIVQNLSLQTDSTDLLGGYRPLEIQNVARNVYKDFVDAFVSSFSRKQNLKFLQYASSMVEKSNWKKLSQCFKRAAHLGLKKMKESSNSDSLKETWQNCALFSRNFYIRGGGGFSNQHPPPQIGFAP